MRWKKMLIAAAVFIVVLIAAIYVFVAFFDFNTLKPTIARAVREATGRELTIAGDIDMGLSFPPTLTVEDASFQNAPWSSSPNLARVKRMEVQIALLPLILGNLDFIRLYLIEPEVIVEFDSAGISNFAFEPSDAEEAEETIISPPPLVFSSVYIEKGLFTYRDIQRDFKFAVRIDRLEAAIPGFEESLSLDFTGAFNNIELSLNGSVGPIWAWVEPGYSLPADFTVSSAGASAHVKGEIRDPTNLRDLSLTVTAQGPSIIDIARLAGAADVPELGPFRVSAHVADPDGKLAFERLDIQVGSQELAEISLTGSVKDILARRGLNLDFAVHGSDAANLTKLGLPPPPTGKAFGLSGRISDPEIDIYSISDLKFIFGEDEINGRAKINLADAPPRLSADLNSDHFILGPLKTAFILSGPADKLALEKLDLQIGSENLVTIKLNGSIKDLMNLQGADLHFSARGEDFAKLQEFTGRPLPLRGAYNAAGNLIVPAQGVLNIPKLQVSVGKNRIDGTVGLNLTDKKPRLNLVLSTQQLDLQHVLIPKLAEQDWVKPLAGIRPIKLAVNLSGFTEDFAVEKLELQAGNQETVEVRLAGSIENVPAQGGIDLDFHLGGKDVAKLKELAGQKYFLAPIPIYGTYALSGNLTSPSPKNLTISDLRIKLGENNMNGWIEANLASGSPQIAAEISTPRFNLKSLRLEDKDRLANLMKLEDLGPFRLKSKVTVISEYISLERMDFQVGTDQLAVIDVKGAIRNLSDQTGIDLKFKIHGREIANLEKITGQSLPLQGEFTASGRITDPAAKEYRLSDLLLILGQNKFAGRLDLNLAAKPQTLEAELSAPKFNLQPVTLDAIKPLAAIEDLGPLKLAVSLTGSANKFAMKSLDLNVGSEQLAAMMLKGTVRDLTALKGVELEFAVRGTDLANLKAIGGPELPLQGPFQVSGQLSDPEPKFYKFPSLSVVLGDNDAEGSLELDLTGTRPRVTAELSSHKMDLRPVLETDGPKETPEPVPDKSGKKGDKVFSIEPFDFKGLKLVDADLKIRNKQVLLRGLAFDDVSIDLKLEDGNLTVKPLKLKLGEGHAGGWFSLVTRQGDAAIETDIDFDKLDLGAMFDALGTERMTSGTLDGGIKVSGRGNSMAELMGGLNGRTYLVLGEGQVAKSQLDLMSMNLGAAFIKILNPFQDKKEHTMRNCAVNRIDIEDGLADFALLYDTEQTTIVAGGDINLKTEALSIGIKPHPKKGFLQGSTVGISLNLSELSRPFKLGGTLAEPALAIDPGRSILTLGKLAGVLVFGPVGVVALLADFSGSDENACLKAIESAKEKTGTTTEALEKEKEKEKSKKEKKSSGFFKRLFGN